jgi:hypothetical protein
MLRRPEPRKSSCPLRSSIVSEQETKAPSNKRTTAGCCHSGSGESVIKSLCFSESKASTTPSHRPRDDVVASQPEARGGCCSATASPFMRVHSYRRVRAPAATQPRRNEQALPVERLCKFYPSGDMSGSIPVYVAQGFYTFNRACLPCSPVSIVFRNKSGAAEPQ